MNACLAWMDWVCMIGALAYGTVTTLFVVDLFLFDGRFLLAIRVVEPDEDID